MSFASVHQQMAALNLRGTSTRPTTAPVRPPFSSRPATSTRPATAPRQTLRKPPSNTVIISTLPVWNYSKKAQKATVVPPAIKRTIYKGIGSSNNKAPTAPVKTVQVKAIVPVVYGLFFMDRLNGLLVVEQT
jgi:hypothetical protein